MDISALSPISLALSPLAAGHGLFGSQSEVAGGYLSDYANANGYVLCAVDEIGLSGEGKRWSLGAGRAGSVQKCFLCICARI